MNAVEVRNVSFNYKGAFVFDKLNFAVEKGEFVTILGKRSSGKSTLFKIFSNSLNFSGNIFILKKSIKYNIDKGFLGFISADCDYFKCASVLEEFINVLSFKLRSSSRMKGDIERVCKKLDIVNLLNRSISSLTIKEKMLVMVAYQLLLKPKVLIIDNLFSFLDDKVPLVLKELKRLNKHCTVVNITNYPSECLYGNEVIFLSDNFQKKVSELDVNDFVKNDLDIPFPIILSDRLKFYNLIDTVYYDIEKLVDVLWQ
ncbi:MAG: ATP-binding cassette domain-containing protein [Bacilli bacterium]|nr:ATP-binding cassette domain-containing protein [Bacilli bacterium]